MKLKTILKQLMKTKGLTLEKLSKATGVPKQTLHNWLTGMEPKSLSHLKEVARYFEMSIEGLCFGESPKLRELESLSEYQTEINAGIFEVVLRRVKQE